MPRPRDKRALGRVTRHLLSQLSCLAWASSNHHQGPCLPHPFYLLGSRAQPNGAVGEGGRCRPKKEEPSDQRVPQSYTSQPLPWGVGAHAAASCASSAALYNLAH